MQENRKDNSPIKKRILQYLEFKGVTKYRFYKEAMVTNGVLNQNNGITEDNLLKALSYAKDINLEWVIFGRGEMLNIDTINEPHVMNIRKDLTITIEKVEEILQLKNECYEKGNRIIKLLDENTELRKEIEEMKKATE